MKNSVQRGMGFWALVVLACGRGVADVRIGVKIGTPQQQVTVQAESGPQEPASFRMEAALHFGVPTAEVQVVRDVDDDEVPVVLFIASRARVAPAVIVDLRRKGKSWFAISRMYGLGAEVFYVPADDAVVRNTPYGRAYGYYNKKPRHQWGTIVLDDADVVNLVNLRFFVERHGMTVGEVVALRGAGRKFAVIHAQKRAKKPAAGKAGNSEGPGHGKRGKGKKH